MVVPANRCHLEQSLVVLSQEKWVYVLPKMLSEFLNDISDVMDRLTDNTSIPYELVRTVC